MAGRDFESIMDGQFPPHLEDYYFLQLDDKFPHISPHSGVARMVTDLYKRCAEAESEYYELQEEKYDAGIYGDMWREERYAAYRNFGWTDLRCLIFNIVYDGVEQGLRDKMAYGEAVSHGVRTAFQEIDERSHMGAGYQGTECDELMHTAQEAGSFLALEEGQHFTELEIEV